MSQKLVKRLEQTKARDFKENEGDEIVKEAETLLLGAHDADLELLGKLGLNHQVKYDQMRRDDYRRTKKAEELYGRSSFTGKQIKDLCGKYYLKMLPVQNYNGTIPSDLARTIREFCEERNLEIRSECFYVLAPTEQFATIKKVPRKADPILFYRQPDNTTNRYREADEKDVFTQVVNWGNDFSEFRKLLYWFSTYDKREFTSESNMTYRSSTFSAILFIVASLINGVIFDNFIFSVILLIPALIIMIYNSLSNPSINNEWNTNRI